MIKTLLLAIILWSQSSYSQDNQFFRFFNELNALSANFVQTVYNSDNAPTEQSFGHLIFKHPSQLIWHVKSPVEQILLLDGDELQVIDVELEQVVLHSIEELTNTALYYLVNKPDLAKKTPVFSFSEKYIDWYTDGSQEALFGFKNNLLVAISLKNQLNQTILITFDQIDLSPHINSNTFNISLKDFDIIKPL